MFKHISEILQANQFAQARLKEIIVSLLPGGQVKGSSYIALNPTRPDKNLGSFRIDLVSGKWVDFATNDKGRDIVSLCAYVKGLSQFQAALYLLKSFGYFGKNSANTKNDNHENSKYIAPKVAKVPKVVDSSYFERPKIYLNSPKVPKASKSGNNSAIDFALKIWNKCDPADNSPVAEYLKSRGYTEKILDSSIRYHPKLFHFATQAYYPAMLSLITKGEQNKVIRIHRTYLTSVDGKVTKAPIEPNKMILGQAKGGSVRLGSPGKKLVITEGIETALSIIQATALPVWAGLSTIGMQNIIVPPLDITPEIIIAADNDEAGLKAANKLACRLLAKGYITRIAIPPKLGSDFNDLLLMEK
jgi:hypothetical protein